jgi:hypothetical protein
MLLSVPKTEILENFNIPVSSFFYNVIITIFGDEPLKGGMFHPGKNLWYYQCG